MKAWSKILIAAAAATAAVVVAKKVIDEIEKNDRDSKIVKGYRTAVDTVKNLINGVQEGKPKNFSTSGYDVDFCDEDDELCRCMCDECLFDDGCGNDEDCVSFMDTEEDQDFFDDSLEFVQTENAEPTEEEMQAIIDEELAQEHIDQILSEMDIEDGDTDEGTDDAGSEE